MDPKALNAKHRNVMLGAGAAAVLLVGALAWQLTGSPSTAGGSSPGQAFYTADDGASYFAAPADLVPPADWNGKTAVKALVFQCGGKKFVGYMERFTPEAKSALAAARGAKAGDPVTASAAQALGSGVEVKKPGAGNKWASRRSAAAAEVLNVTCPPGSSGTPEPVMP
jgi:hypothetical protein